MGDVEGRVIQFPDRPVPVEPGATPPAPETTGAMTGSQLRLVDAEPPQPLPGNGQEAQPNPTSLERGGLLIRGASLIANLLGRFSKTDDQIWDKYPEDERHFS